MFKQHLKPVNQSSFQRKEISFHQADAGQASIRFPFREKILKKPVIRFPSQQKWPLNSPAKDTGRKQRGWEQLVVLVKARGLQGERAKGETAGKKVNRRKPEPAAAAGLELTGRGNPRCRERGGEGEPKGSGRRREGSSDAAQRSRPPSS